MATQSENYGFTVGMTTDDFVAPEHVDRPARTVDRVLGALARQLLSAGVYAGWAILEDKTVSAGSGLIAGAWGETTVAQAISGLTSGAVNYVCAHATADTPPSGTVNFVAQLQPTAPPSAIRLGTITLDAEGAVTNVDNSSGDRGCFALLSDTLRGSGTVAAVAGGQATTVEISHAMLAIPGALSCDGGEHFSMALEQTWRGDGFVVVATNGDTAAHDLAYEWERRGIRA